MIDVKAARHGQFTGNLKLILNGLTWRHWPGSCRLAGRDDAVGSTRKVKTRATVPVTRTESEREKYEQFASPSRSCLQPPAQAALCQWQAAVRVGLSDSEAAPGQATLGPGRELSTGKRYQKSC